MNHEASDYELRAIQEWASKDDTRPHLARVYTYTSEDGRTYVATDGHRLVIRRSGSHVERAYSEIARMPHDGGEMKPPAWEHIMGVSQRTALDPELDNRSIDPNYFAALAQIEKVAGKRAAADFVPTSGMSKKVAAQARANLLRVSSSLAIPSDPLDPWRFRILTDGVRWDGCIAPRRP